VHRLILLSALALAACGAPTPKAQISYRDAGLGLYSNAVMDPARIVGDWRQVAAFAQPNAPDCRAGAVRLQAAGEGAYDMQADLCLPGEPALFSGRAEMPTLGRLVLSGADPQGIGQPWWIIWVDNDYRTMVIGTPSGRFGMILNRDDRLPADRLAAAREILGWGGYDLTKLRLLTR
jgi:apolipoprotein D and lipocalin family protein